MSSKVHGVSQLELAEQVSVDLPKLPRSNAKRANELDGATWTKYSLSIWSDIKKSAEEVAFHHPAIFPVALVQRLIRCFMTSTDRVVLDPFSGSGSSLIGATLEKKQGVGFEIVPSYVELTKQRLSNRRLPFDAASYPASVVHQSDARDLGKTIAAESVDFCLTSPPYWNILSQKRTGEPR